MSIKTQGTEMFFIDNITAPEAPKIVKLKCPTGISGILTSPKDQIEDTCLSDLEDKSFISGLGSPGSTSVPFNLDPKEESHQILFEMKAKGEKTSFIVGLSDGSAIPTISGDVMTPPEDRTSFTFLASVTDVDIEIAVNTIVVGTLTLQRSGSATPNWKV